MKRRTRRRLEGPERVRWGKRLAREYERGYSIRGLCDKHDLSFGVIRRLLIEQEVTFRGPGGDNRRRRT
jgi:hypothetical protein